MIIENQKGDNTAIEIIPAIDLREGRCVRLYQGDYAQETIYSDDPVEVALEWQSLGASRLHIVDLDGAAKGEVCNLDIITQIASTMLIPTQLGGGIRDLETIKQLLKAGIERIILAQPPWKTLSWLRRHAAASESLSLLALMPMKETSPYTAGGKKQG